MATQDIPVFVRRGAAVPIAEPVPCIRPDIQFQIELRCYGGAGRFPFVLDDGVTNRSAGRILQTDDDGRLEDNPRYKIKRVRRIG